MWRGWIYGRNVLPNGVVLSGTEFILRPVSQWHRKHAHPLFDLEKRLILSKANQLDWLGCVDRSVVDINATNLPDDALPHVHSLPNG
jgi:hypothetical protein